MDRMALNPRTGKPLAEDIETIKTTAGLGLGCLCPDDMDDLERITERMIEQHSKRTYNR